MWLVSWLAFPNDPSVALKPFKKFQRRRLGRGASAAAELLEARQMLAPVSIVPVGTEVRVNTQTQNDQSSSVIAMDNNGDYVVAWASVLPGSSQNQIRAQRYTASGAAQGTEIQVSSVTASYASPAVAMDNNGDFVIAFSNNSGVFAQRFNSSGAALGTQMAISAPDANLIADPKVAMDASGDFVVAWTEMTQAGSGLIFARRINSAGLPQGNQFQVGGQIPAVSSIEVGVAANAQGAFVVTWLDNNSQGSDEFLAQRFDATGAALGAEIFVNAVFTGSFKNPSIAMDAAGDFVISWMRFSTLNTQQGGIGGTYGVYAQTFNAAGTPKAGMLVSANAQNASVAMDAAGDFVVAWQSYAVGGNFNGLDGSGSGIYGQKYTAAGQTQGNSFMVNTYTTGQQALPSAAIDAAGDFVVVWQSPGQDGSGQGVYAQRFTTEFPPGLTGLGQTLVYLSGTSPIAVAPNAVVSIAQNFQIASATVAFTNWQDEDRLDFTNSAGLQHAFTVNSSAHTATLTITGAASASTYQTFLRSITFQDVAGLPNTSAIRTAQISVSNGFLSASGTQTIQVATTLQGLGQTVNYISGSAPTSVAPNLAITLPAGGTLASATVSFGNWQEEDRLSFTNSFALQHAFTVDPIAQTATLTITGTDTAAHYQTLLQSVVYQDVAGNPITSIVRLATITVNDGTTSTSGYQDIVAATVLENLNGTTIIIQGGAPQPIAPNLVVTLATGQTVSSATVSFTNWQAEDRLSFSNSAGLQHTLTVGTSTATLTLTGNDTTADYQNVLRSVAFQDVAGQPNTTISRIATITVNSGSTSSSGTQNVVVQKVFSGLSGSVTYAALAAPVAISPKMVIALPAAQTIASAKVSFTDWLPEDRLSFTNRFALQNTFTQSDVTNTATLAITGIDTIAHYQQTLSSIVYSDATRLPNTSAIRVATFTVTATDGFTQNSDPQSIVVLDSARPVIDLNDTSVISYAPNAAALSIFTRSLVTDPDSQFLTQLTVQITSGYLNSATTGTDVLACTNQNGITGIFNSTTGTLTLSGTAYVGYYRQILRTVTFQSTGTNEPAGTRVLTLIATDDGSPTPSTSIPVTRSITVT